MNAPTTPLPPTADALRDRFAAWWAEADRRDGKQPAEVPLLKRLNAPSQPQPPYGGAA